MVRLKSESPRCFQFMSFAPSPLSLLGGTSILHETKITVERNAPAEQAQRFSRQGAVLPRAARSRWASVGSRCPHVLVGLHFDNLQRFAVVHIAAAKGDQQHAQIAALDAGGGKFRHRVGSM
jgi:hypothetical protein